MGTDQYIKVSVIVPVYNAEPYFRTCLGHLEHQTLKEIEIVLVDDCSTDNCGAICDEFASKDARFRVIHNASNIKQGLSLNKGIGVAKGEYIGFLGADDWVDDDYFEKLYLAAKKNNSDIAKTGLITLYLNGRVVKSNMLNTTIQKGIKKGLPLNSLFTHEHTTAIFRKALIIKHEIKFPDIRNAQDIIFLLHATYYLTSISLISGTYYYYRHHTGSTTHINTRPYFESSLQCFQLHLDFINSHEMYKKTYDFLFYRGLIGVTKRFPQFTGKPELEEYSKEYTLQTLKILTGYKYDAGFLINNLVKGIYRQDQLSKISNSSLFQLFAKLIQIIRQVRNLKEKIHNKIKGFKPNNP